MRVRFVDPANRMAYQNAVAAAGIVAGEIGAHFWAFEVDGGESRFAEFLEGPEDGTLTELHAATQASLREASGGADVADLQVGSGGLKGTGFS